MHKASVGRKTMLRFIIVRPGQTEIDEQGRIKGNLDVPLTASGTTQVRQTADELNTVRFDAIYTGPCLAARQTAEQLANVSGKRSKVVDLFRNLDLGLWNGRRIEELKETQPRVYRQWQDHPETVCPPGGETLEDAQQRLRKALLKIVKRRKHGTVVLVLMEPLASIASSLLLSKEIGDLWKAETDCGSYESIDLEPQLLATDLNQS